VTTNPPTAAVIPSRWPHRAAVLLVCVTFPLLWIGGWVTSTDSGMAVPDWPTTYGYNPFLYPLQTWFHGPRDIFYEHSHRLVASAVGLATILLLATMWFCERRRWVVWTSLGALVLVIAQGVLGGLRVVLGERTLAQLHGCVGPLFFALAVAIAAFTSRWWLCAQRRADPRAARLQRLAVATVAVAYLQLVLGTFVRHVSEETSVGEFRLFTIFHLLMAAVLTAHIAILGFRVVRTYFHERLLLRPAIALVGLIALQICLGAGTWLTHYGPPAWLSDISWLRDNRWLAGYTVHAGSMWQAHITTAHVAVGSLILGTSMALALRSLRLLKNGASARAEQKLVEVAV
jgi:cytochrome c oxidase assembly protein subunit 15